ncbi:hypothetical protein [Erythrobacter sp. JK5]|uniref:hypothetical protein n=1 Tax=Erythrobacter sp. JK5 TaxID=2829500 RepID=UPI001BA85551|nr:hypothetical protein [Erythrobacter sp. JK5]QUL38341.1 hypothetical protein KDC96_02690 [Erythrobacter sp. JK5]
MKAIYLHVAGALALTCLIAACVPAPRTAAPAPAATPAPAPRPAPPPAPVVTEPVFDNYLDAPQTPGDWSYAAESQETFAIFGTGRAEPLAIVRCDLRTRRIGIGRFGSNRAAAAMRIRTETRTGMLEAVTRESGSPLVAAEIDARDALLDAMAITKGRFALEVEGERTLYLPAWVEVTRVIEDCR